MNTAKLDYIVDVITFILFLITALTGIILKFALPGSRVRQREFLGITKSNLEFVHDWIGILMIFFVAIHIILHWNWIITMTRRFFRRS